MSNLVQLGPQYFPMSSIGTPVGAGSLYIGDPDTDPTVIGNQKTIEALKEDNTLIILTQPVTLSAGGIPLYNGSPVSLYVSGNYSLTILDINDAQIYYVPSIYKISSEDPLSPGNYYYPDYGEADQGVTGNDETIKFYVDQIGTIDKATIYLRHNSGNEFTDYLFSTTEVIPSNITIERENGARIQDDASNADLTINGPFVSELTQAFDWGNGTGTLSFGNNVHEIMVEWMGHINGTADDVQINLAIAAAANNQVIKAWGAAYTCTSSIAIDKSITLSIGQTVLTSTADPVIQITADDVAIIGINRKVSKLINTTAGEHIIRSVGATRSGITIGDIDFTGGNTVYVAQDREYEQAIWFGNDPYVGHHTNIMIKNCCFADAFQDILFQFVDDSKIINNIFKHGTANNVNVNLWSCDRVIIKGTTFIDTSAGCTNAIEVLGVADDNSSNVIIAENTFNGNYLEVINLAANKSQIIGNNIYSNVLQAHFLIFSFSKSSFLF